MDRSIRPEHRRRFVLRFGVASLLFLVTCIAGYLGGYNSGMRNGAADQAALAVSTRSYEVGDLIRPLDSPTGWVAVESDYDELVDLISSTICSEEWQTGGGEIRPFPSSKSLVVNCRGVVHDELSRLLKQLRDLRYSLPDSFLKDTRELVSRRVPQIAILKAFQQSAVELNGQMEGFFLSAEADLREEYGTPSVSKVASDSDFPEWIGAKRLAVWNRGSGKLYLAVRDCRPTGLALVVGWWEESVGEVPPIHLATDP